MWVRLQRGSYNAQLVHTMRAASTCFRRIEHMLCCLNLVFFPLSLTSSCPYCLSSCLVVPSWGPFCLSSRLRNPSLWPSLLCVSPSYLLMWPFPLVVPSSCFQIVALLPHRTSPFFPLVSFFLVVPLSWFLIVALFPCHACLLLSSARTQTAGCSSRLRRCRSRSSSARVARRGCSTCSAWARSGIP